MAKRLIIVAVGVLLAAMLVAWMLTMPKPLSAATLPSNHRPNLVNGQELFNAGNCAGCHQTPGQDDRKVLGGGLQLKSPFGTFVAPNISSDKTAGIGGWSDLEFVNAVKRGVGRGGEHLYPSFPYPSYSMMTTSDVLDLFAYLKSLPAVAKAAPGHQLAFPYTIRRAVGGWKLLYFRPTEFTPDASRSAVWNRGRYLVEGLGHCRECHSPRDQFGGILDDKAYAGAPSLEAGGRFATNITPSKDGIGHWSEQDMADFLSTGTDRCYNEPLGMAEVLASTTKLSPESVAAMANYLHTLPPKSGNAKETTC